ncbi:cartilage acidic protein 1 isoform X4 [Manis pentadactyla]|uniref:cartilage acidic protein 1 isoform X4 n=1 Tax=Manis pentadactyla TaxID=143292 RepID=UPI00255C449D|nr:cartilage acidic protein 1 isoform X4 [Manis pentadactyla]
MFKMLLFLLLLWFLPPTEGSQHAEPMFTAVTNSVLPPDYDSNPTQLNYGVAVTDVDHDGDFEIVVAGYNGPNLVLKYDRAQKRLVNIAVDERSSPYYALRDRQGNAIGVTACDIDGDGREEIYFLNTNNAFSGGRGVSVGPILSSSASDIFCDNENGPNFLFHNQGDGTFVDAAAGAGVDDPHQHGRGVALADFNRDGKVDIVYGNWNGPHRLYLQMSAHGKVRFRDIASPKFSMPSPVRTVIAADFDNDQELEIFFNNFAHRSSSANRLFRVIRRDHGDPLLEELNPGDALEPEGRGTGGVVTDFDGDGMLDLILSHGESMAQPLSVFRGSQGFSNNWLRVVPRTRFGAFARGAKVVLYTKKSGAHLRIIDGGSGYLCEMEPVAHFGLGKDEASSVEVTWPDGKMASRSVASGEMNSVLEIPYPRDEDRLQDPAPLECGRGFSQQENGHCMDTNECIQFPFVCPRDKPVCVNTYGSYWCRTNKRCSRGYEPNEDGTACVAFLGASGSAWPGPAPSGNSQIRSGRGSSCQRGGGAAADSRGQSPPSRQAGPREWLRSGCFGSAAAAGLRGPQSGRTPPCRDSRPVTGPRRRPRRCCRWSCRCRCWSCRCCTGPRRWKSRSAAALRSAASCIAGATDLGDRGQLGSGTHSRAAC